MTNNQRNRMRGWFNEPYLHRLAAQGIKTKKTKSKPRKHMFGSTYPDSANIHFIQRKPEVAAAFQELSVPSQEQLPSLQAQQEFLRLSQPSAQFAQRKYQFAIFGAKIGDLSPQEQNQALFAQRDALKLRISPDSSDAKKAEVFSKLQQIDVQILANIAKGNERFNMAHKDRSKFDVMRDEMDKGIIEGSRESRQLDDDIDAAMAHDKKMERLENMDFMELSEFSNELQGDIDAKKDLKLVDEVFKRKMDEEDAKVRGIPRRHMAYAPTFVAADLPLIATSGIGTAGITAVGLIPLAVTAGAIYYGTKAVKKGLKKTKKR